MSDQLKMTSRLGIWPEEDISFKNDFSGERGKSGVLTTPGGCSGGWNFVDAQEGLDTDRKSQGRGR